MEITIKCEATGFDMGTREDRVISFKSHLEWVNKATNWVRPDDTLIDSEGRVVRNGRDAKAAKYPVSVYRMVGCGE